MDDDLWVLIEPLLPPWPERSPGPKPVPDRLCLQGILYVLHQDIAWQLLPLEMGFGAAQTLSLPITSSALVRADVRDHLSGVRVPRINAIMERWVQTCRRELLDRTLIWNHRHLLHVLREFEQFSNELRPHEGIANARPLHPLPSP